MLLRGFKNRYKTAKVPPLAIMEIFPERGGRWLGWNRGEGGEAPP